MLFRIFPHSPIPIWKSFALPSQVWGGNGRLFAEAHGGTYLHEPTQPDSLQDPKGLHRILTKLLLDQMADGAWQNVKTDKHIPYTTVVTSRGLKHRPVKSKLLAAKLRLRTWIQVHPFPLKMVRSPTWPLGWIMDQWQWAWFLNPISQAGSKWSSPTKEYFQRRHGINLQRKQPMLYCPFRAKQEADGWSRGLGLFWCFVLWSNWLGSYALFVVNFTLWSGLFVAGLFSIFFWMMFYKNTGWFFQ